MDSIKIQINDRSALERLIGGDSQLEIEARNSIVQDFAKKYLKVQIEHYIDNAARSTVVEVLKEENYLDTKFYNTLTPQFKEVIKRQVDKYINELIFNNTVTSPLISKLLETVELQIQQAANTITNQLSEKVLEGKLDRMVDAKIKQKLGL